MKAAMKQANKILVMLMALILYSNLSIAQLHFKQSQNFATNFESRAIATGDLNNDGLTDVAIASDFNVLSYSSEVYLFYQQLNGTLSAPFTLINNGSYPGIATITIGDINNDNRQDLLIGYADKIGIFYQDLFGNMNTIRFRSRLY
jgi:hypothetical protein